MGGPIRKPKVLRGSPSSLSGWSRKPSSENAEVNRLPYGGLHQKKMVEAWAEAGRNLKKT